MGGGYISSIEAVASRDGQHILTAAGCSIRLYSVATAALVAELTGHIGDVTAVVLHPHNAKKVRPRIIVCHLAGSGWRSVQHAWRAYVFFFWILDDSMTVCLCAGILSVQGRHCAAVGYHRGLSAEDLCSQRAHRKLGEPLNTCMYLSM